MDNLNKTMYVTGNSIKVEDMRKVLGENIDLFKTNVEEIQGNPLRVSEDKIRKIFLEKGSVDVACEDTSFGHGKLAVVVKDFVETCSLYEGDLFNVMKAIAPKETNVDYTSILSFKNSSYEAFFECVMVCELCPRTAKGGIDPFAIPIEFTLVQHINGVRTVLIEKQKIDNPNKQSIAQQPEKRDLIHPRYFALRAYYEWHQHNVLRE